MTTIELPNKWKPRPYQFPLWNALQNEGKRRAIEIAHRRWGKDDVILHHTAIEAHKRVATYWHCLPEYEQARKAIWNAVNPHTGIRRIDEAFPEELRASKDEQQMFIRFKNGSTWQVIGSDRYNSLVGAGVAGVVFSEWALCNPSSWGYIRPMMEENNGWATFITTPRGNNHAKAMFDMARGNPSWFAEISTVRDTLALTEQQLEESKAEYIALFGKDMGTAQFEQEYYCSFNAAILGAYWGSELSEAETSGRVREVEIDWAHPVHTAWDLGKAVNNPIWCFQVISGQLRIVDFYRPESDDLSDWCEWLSSRGYNGDDYVPDDVMDFIWGAKHTRWDLLKAHKRKPKLVKRIAVADGIHAGREAIKVATFHGGGGERAERVNFGRDGLKNYRREWDDDLKTYRENPVKDWAEHIGSSWRYLGLAWREANVVKPKEPPKTESIYQAMPDGTIKSNMSVREAVDAMIKRKRASR